MPTGDPYCPVHGWNWTRSCPCETPFNPIHHLTRTFVNEKPLEEFVEHLDQLPFDPNMDPGLGN